MRQRVQTVLRAGPRAWQTIELALKASLAESVEALMLKCLCVSRRRMLLQKLHLVRHQRVKVLRPALWEQLRAVRRSKIESL